LPGPHRCNPPLEIASQKGPQRILRGWVIDPVVGIADNRLDMVVRRDNHKAGGPQIDDVIQGLARFVGEDLNLLCRPAANCLNQKRIGTEPAQDRLFGLARRYLPSESTPAA